jgi:hypothetical protein
VIQLPVEIENIKRKDNRTANIAWRIQVFASLSFTSDSPFHRTEGCKREKGATVSASEWIWSEIFEQVAVHR